MQTEPVITIGAVFTSLEAAVIAVITVVALQLELTAEMTAAVVGAGSAITVAVGSIVSLILTRNRVTPV